MSDIVLGMIIGGLIGVVGSAVAALIQGYYSLKGRREENSARERQQSMQIKHEKDSQLIAMLIATRSSYLKPLSSYLSQLFRSLDNYQIKLVKMLTPYWCDSESDQIEVPEGNKQAFGQQLESTKTELEAVVDKRRQLLGETSSHISDIKLLHELSRVSDAVSTFYSAANEMYTGFDNSSTGHDFVYDFQRLMKSIADIQLNISNAQRRIDSLLAGLEEDNE